MIIDELTSFASDQAMTGAAGVILSENVIDLGTVPRDMGVGARPIWCTVVIKVAPTTCDTCQFALVSDSVAAIHATTRTEHFITGAIAIADLPVGTIPLQIALPMEGQVYERYLGIQQTNAGAGSLAALVIDAFLTLDAPKNRSYPDASN